jgi:hypothetical protein
MPSGATIGRQSPPFRDDPAIAGQMLAHEIHQALRSNVPAAIISPASLDRLIGGSEQRRRIVRPSAFRS